MRTPSRLLALALCCLWFVPCARAGDTPRVATFCCDVTPPLGQPLVGGDRLGTVEQPLLAKGIVLEADGQRYVLCAVDWCELRNGSYDAFRQSIAQAANTLPAHVAAQTVHQHTAPLADSDAYNLLLPSVARDGCLDPKVTSVLAARLAAAVRGSIEKLQPFDQVGVGQAKVERIASSRRCKDMTGKIQIRWSSCGDAATRALPEGTIDPYLKTITLANNGKPLVRLHYYATHPQTFYRDGRASSDMAGDAREALEQKEGVFQIYFNGCGGDITVGKYNTGDRKDRKGLAERLLAGMEAAIAATKLERVGPMRWRTCPLQLPARTDAGFSLAEGIDGLKSAKPDRMEQGALCVAFHRRNDRPIELTSLEIGKIHIVHLPGEPMIEFQRYAQQRKPDAFVAVAGYGDCGPGYVCTEAAFGEGGYEPTASLVKPESEGLLKKAIAALLGVGDAAGKSANVDHARLMAYWTADGHEEPVRNAEDWAIRRQQIVKGMEQAMGPLPDVSQLLPPEVTLGERIDGDGFVRVALTYLAEKDDRVPA